MWYNISVTFFNNATQKGAVLFGRKKGSYTEKKT
jgi:hypothetical protein